MTVPAGPLASITISSPTGASWDFLVLFLVVIVGPPLVKQARVPGIIGLLLGGFLIGPHGLDWIGQGNATVPELGQLGLLYLMFTAGVELDLTLLRVHRRSVLDFSMITFFLPMTFGTLTGLFVLGWSTPAALLLGSLAASHTLVLYPDVRAAGLTADKAVATAVGATVVTDTMALIVLAAVSGSETTGGGTAAVALQIVVGLAVLLFFSLWVLPRIARFILRHLGTDRTVRYLVIFASFLGAATVAESFGIEGIVGAFFAGLALNRLVPNEGPMMDRIDFFGSAVFIPVFLVSVGLLLDPSVMFEAETLGFAGLFIAACVGGKAIAALVSRPVLGFSKEETGMVFALSTPQAAATLAATVVGFNIGLFSESVVNAVLVLILASIIVATIVMERVKGKIPVPSAAGGRLGRRVMVVLDDESQAGVAFEVAARIARPDGGVVKGMYAAPIDQADGADRGLIALGETAIEAGIDAEPRLLVHSSLAEEVVLVATEEDASLVLVGERDPGAASAVLGDWSEAVAGASSSPVAIVRGDAERVENVLYFRTDPERSASDDANALAVEIAVRVGGVAVEAAPAILPDSIDDLEPGNLAVVSIASWDILVEMPAPPSGAAAVLVLEPSARALADSVEGGAVAAE